MVFCGMDSKAVILMPVRQTLRVSFRLSMMFWVCPWQ